jgi:hypothetical protein
MMMLKVRLNHTATYRTMMMFTSYTKQCWRWICDWTSNLCINTLIKPYIGQWCLGQWWFG